MPSSQVWLVVDEDNNIADLTFANVTVAKGGAISQGLGNSRQTVTNSCAFQVPLSGNWNGTIVRITSTGGGCGVGYILTMEGNSQGEYGDATTWSGTYRISYTGAFSGTYTGDWRGSLDH